jgi:FlaA1/EpsC-like NDP-sugar epimerase
MLFAVDCLREHESVTRRLYDFNEYLTGLSDDKRRAVKMTADGVIIAFAYALSFLLRFDFSIPRPEFMLYAWSMPVLVALSLAFYLIFGIYTGFWMYWSFRELKQLVIVHTFTIMVFLALALGMWCLGYPLIPRSIFIIHWLVGILFLISLRVGYRLFLEKSVVYEGKTKRLILVGAGHSGEMLLNQIQTHPDLKCRVVGLIDDDERKWNRSIHGVKVMGGSKAIVEAAKSARADEIILAVPTATSKELRDIAAECERTGLPFRLVPGARELMDGRVSYNRVRQVRIEDLLGREQSEMDETKVRSLIEGKRILVTGAAGSIGSELCAQIQKFEPAELVALDKDENRSFYLGNRLAETGPIECVVADAAHRKKMESLFKIHRPQIVFHSAAYKHVPSMETVPEEAVMNNLGATLVMAGLSRENGVEHFIQISTDKAVYPSNIMGASKRLCELAVQNIMLEGKKGFISVRFGNVIGSQGSVFTVFDEQIRAGKPVTVTHPDMKRYFMTIPEACRLVLEAATFGNGGCLFMLDMGEPIRIADLARHMISLAGLKPDEDIPIRFTGLRPGERLEEKLWYKHEKPVRSGNPKIFVIHCSGGMPHGLAKKLDEIMELAGNIETDGMMQKIREVIPEYRRAGG